jgi:hypothetical protein
MTYLEIKSNINYMNSEITRFIPMLLAFIVLYKATDVMYKKSIKQKPTDDVEHIKFRDYINYKLKLGRNFFLFMFFFFLILLIYELVLPS